MDMDDEEEVDQLDSDLDEDDNIVPNGSPSSSKTRPRRTGERLPGHTLIPHTRVENILHADGSGGHMSKEALFALSVATEEFVKRLAQASERAAGVQKHSIVNYRDVASVTKTYPQFKFLQDMIPAPTTLTHALQLRAAREKELADDDPAIAPPPPVALPIPPPDPSTQQAFLEATAAKSRTRARQSNGQEKPNGTASTSSSNPRRQRDNRGRYSQTAQNGEEGASESRSVSAHAASVTRTSSVRVRSRSTRGSDAQESASMNGVHRTNGAESASHGAMLPPAVPPPRASYAAEHPPNPNLRHEGTWMPGHYTGPASGYLDDHRVLFGGMRGGSMTDAPGRTIYSQQRPTHSNR